MDLVFARDVESWSMRESDDWRWRCQDEKFAGVELTFKTYGQYSETWDHDHCEFCFAKFLPPNRLDEYRRLAPNDEHELLTEGYTTTDSYTRGADYAWICVTCFSDFDDLIKWEVVPQPE